MRQSGLGLSKERGRCGVPVSGREGIGNLAHLMREIDLEGSR